MKLLKNLSPTVLLSGLKQSKDLFTSFGSVFTQFNDDIKLSLAHKKVAKGLKNLNCPVENMQESYMHMESNHLEIFPFHGLLIKDNHRLLDSFPIITALDDNKDSLKDIQKMFEGTFCRVQTSTFDINNFNLNPNKKFGSIALNFALDKINGDSKKIEEFIVKVKGLLQESGGIVFGLSAPYLGLNHKKNALGYIKNKNDLGEWSNLDFSVNDLQKILKKHFDQYGLYHIGSCVIFRGIINKKIPDLAKHRPTLESLRGKHLKVQPEDFYKWVRNLEKFKK
ncbi:MAG: hypothetical protein LBH40_01965 [Alphaproteobacteria bacterium]|jgi:hypothetical protein|nr:hypothetical protein [Alphaproteobacteria bacterium]